MTTFTIYKAEKYNFYRSADTAKFDTFLYLDGDLSNWDTQDEYQLPQGWQFIEGNGEDFSYLLTDNNQVINPQDLNWSSQSEKPYCLVNSKRVYFDKA